jgi:hypothetical protein
VIDFIQISSVIHIAFDIISLQKRGGPTNPNFKDVYGPLGGFVVNVGIRIKLLNL